MNIIEIFTKSIFLIISFDSDLWEIIILSLYVSISALIIASILGLLIGYYIALKKFFFKSFILIVLNSLMGIPPCCSWFNRIFHVCIWRPFWCYAIAIYPHRYDNSASHNYFSNCYFYIS